jgi:hypothetical protein
MGITTALTALSLAASVTFAPVPTGRTVTFSSGCAVPYKLCHMVYTRAYTKNVLAPATSGSAASVLAIMTGACVAVGGPPGGVACAALFGVLSGNANAAVSQAAAQNQCADYVADVTQTVGWFQTNNGPDCHDN